MRVDISGELLEQFESIMKKNGLRTIKGTVEFVLEQYLILSDLEEAMKQRDDNLIDNLLAKFDEKYHNNYVVLKSASKNIEKNSVLLLDAMNTILMNEDYEACHPVDFIKSPVIEKSEERYKERISNLKQKKDNKSL